MSVNIIDIVKRFSTDIEVVKMELLDVGFDYGLPRQDQTMGIISESAIEIFCAEQRSIKRRLPAQLNAMWICRHVFRTRHQLFEAMA